MSNYVSAMYHIISSLCTQSSQLTKNERTVKSLCQFVLLTPSWSDCTHVHTFALLFAQVINETKYKYIQTLEIRILSSNMVLISNRLLPVLRIVLYMLACLAAIGQSDGQGKEKERNLNAFRAIQQRIIDGQLPVRVSFNCLAMNGYGNRVYSVLSSLVLAILTDRALIVSRWPIIKKFIYEPVPECFNDYRHIRSEFNINHRKKSIVGLPLYSGTFKVAKDVDELVQTKLPPDHVKRVQMCNPDALFFAMCANPQTYEKLYNYGLVSRSTIDQAYPMADKKSSSAASASPHQRLESVLRVGFEAAGNLLYHYWRPKPSLRRDINHYVDAHFKGHFVIGIQLRSIYMRGGVQAADMFVECAKAIEANRSVAERATRPVKWLVTSDKQNMYERIRAAHIERVIALNGTSAHVYEVQVNASANYKKTILDNELLSRCDEIIVTGASTFGFVAALKARRLPYHVDWHMNKCARATLSRPPSYASVATFK